MISLDERVWWNGRHEDLKSPWPDGRVGSSPTTRTINMRKPQYIIKVTSSITLYFNRVSILGSPSLQSVLNKNMYNTYEEAFKRAKIISDVYHIPTTVVDVSTLRNVLFVSAIDISLQRTKDASK